MQGSGFVRYGHSPGHHGVDCLQVPVSGLRLRDDAHVVEVARVKHNEEDGPWGFVVRAQGVVPFCCGRVPVDHVLEILASVSGRVVVPRRQPW